MKVVHKRGSSYLRFIFTERTFLNKMRAIFSYDKYTIKSLIYNHQVKITKIIDGKKEIINSVRGKAKACIIRFEYTRKDDFSKRKLNHFYRASIFDSKPITQKRLFPFAAGEAELNYTNFVLMGSDTVKLKEIGLQFIYETS